MNKALCTDTKPAAGVIPTNPATAPDAKPNADGLCLQNTSTNIQVNAPTEAEI